MKILIIDDDYKFTNIADTLNRILDTPSITRAKSRNGGLAALLRSERYNELFDLVVCDNYMPLYDDTYDLKPYAKDIINEIRRRISENMAICVCSSEKIEECYYNYFIQYNSDTLMDETFKAMIFDMLVCKQFQNIEKQDSSEQFMNSFMEKLNTGELKKEICPQIGENFIPTKQNVKKELESYKKLLDSKIIEKVSEEKTIKHYTK